VLRISTFLSVLIFLSLSLASFAEGVNSETESVEEIIQKLYEAWNKHDLEKLFSYYSVSFITGDGVNKSEYKELTQKLWDTYPDIRIENQRQSVRTQDQYATVSGIDFFTGTGKQLNQDLNDFGHINAISQGQIFLKKYGDQWKIVSDKVQFELNSVYYGNAKDYLDEHQIYFGAPEQVHSGELYTGSLYFILPENVSATASIDREIIEVPLELETPNAFQMLSGNKLERLFKSNRINRNELVSATILLSKGIIEPKLDGILLISKRVNVVPKMDTSTSKKIARSAFSEND
jgi:ketosteroid isomerase-like protein